MPPAPSGVGTADRENRDVLLCFNVTVVERVGNGVIAGLSGRPIRGMGVFGRDELSGFDLRRTVTTGGSNQRSPRVRIVATVGIGELFLG